MLSTWRVTGVLMSLLFGMSHAVLGGPDVKNILSQLVGALDGRAKITPMTRGGHRQLSIVSPVDLDDDDSRTTAPKASNKMDGRPSSSRKPMTHGVSRAAANGLDSTSTSKSSSSTVSTASSTAKANSLNSSAAPSSAPSAPATGANSTLAQASNKTKAVTKSCNSTNTTSPANSKTTDSDEHDSKFQRPLPPSYIYKDDDNAPALEIDAPLNPVVDDIAQFLDDDLYGNMTHTVLPPENEPPTSWPLDVFGVFVVVSVVLFAATGYKNYKKRKTYTPVPST